MSQENNIADVQPFVNDFGWTPAKFDVALNDYAKQL
jgi:hypothetical protein